MENFVNRWVFLLYFIVGTLGLSWLSQAPAKLSDLDSYWQKSGLKKSEVEEILSNENCYQNRLVFLACANALASVRQDVGLKPIHPSQHLLWQSKMSDYQKMEYSFIAEYKKIENNLKGIPVESKRASAINGYLNVVKDPHTYLSPKENFETQSVRVEAKMDPIEKTLEIEIPRMSPGVCLDVRSHIIRFQNIDIQKITLDLRNNPGGLFDEVACIASIFMPQKTFVFSLNYFDPVKKPSLFYTQGIPLYLGKLDILVNWKTGSSSELLAGSFQELGRSMILGEKTFGKGSFQAPKKWKNYSDIYIYETVGTMHFPSGKTHQSLGVAPSLNPNSKDDQKTVQRERENELYFNVLMREG